MDGVQYASNGIFHVMVCFVLPMECIVRPMGWGHPMDIPWYFPLTMGLPTGKIYSMGRIVQLSRVIRQSFVLLRSTTVQKITSVVRWSTCNKSWCDPRSMVIHCVLSGTSIILNHDELLYCCIVLNSIPMGSRVGKPTGLFT